MNTDLHFNIGDRYSIALLVFFITYFLFELSTLLLHLIGPKNLLHGLALSWGAVMVNGVRERLEIDCCMSYADWHLGGWLSSLLMFSLSTWYQRFEIQQRMALWYLINLFVSAFGNILAWAIVKPNGAHGIKGWRWIFIIEGAATIGIAIVGYFTVISFPDTMLPSGRRQGFTTHELEVVLDRIERDRSDSQPDKLTWAKIASRG
ncbi:hypothetical protein BDV96DRAFT_677196 [Lophiotrema nucula]|uniref:Major facilitator superfamily domain-containing protein n=1 Tax=Lophiotrema nucula TaxID=690887 RepID=A0A6A5YEE2_9PLEO|nr:hypothetical protein BDV96DRAFT_677196 [Lophiotrema nucula]